MPILTLDLKLPSEFVATATVGTSSDWLIIQKSGETEVSKIAAVPAAVGAAPAGGELATDWACDDLRTASGYLYAQASGGSITGSVDLYDIAASNRMVFRNAAGFQFYGAMSGATLGAVYAGDIYQNGTQILPATGWDTNPVALGSASAGNATTVSRSNHVHPMPSAADVSALPLTGGTISGSLGLSASSGERAVNIGTSRSSDGVSILRFYAQSNGGESAYISRTSGANADMRLKNNGTNGHFRFLITTQWVRNQADDAYANIECGAITYDSHGPRSDPRLKRDMAPVIVPPSTAYLLKDAVIRFNFNHDEKSESPRLGFDAAKLRDILPEISRSRPANPSNAEEAGLGEVLSFDLTGLVATLILDMATLSARLEAAEDQIAAFASGKTS